MKKFVRKYLRSRLLCQRGSFHHDSTAQPSMISIYSWMTVYLAVLLMPFLLIGMTVVSLLLVGVGLLLTRLSQWDIYQRILPDRWNYLVLLAGLIVNGCSLLTSFSDALIGACLGYGILAILRRGYWCWKRQMGLGGGDVKLLAGVGAWGGTGMIAPTLLGACFFGTCSLLVILVMRKVRGSDDLRDFGSIRDYPIPLGPSLAISGWVYLMEEQMSDIN